MATDTQIKVRTAVALDRLIGAAARLAERFPDVEAPEIPTRLRYPEMLPLVQLEAITGFVEALDGAMGGGDTPADESDVDGDPDPPEADMSKMTRAELDAYATECGIENPHQFSTKAQLVEIIEAQRALAEDDE